MNKGDLIDYIASEAGLTKGQSGDALNAVLTAVQKTLKKGYALVNQDSHYVKRMKNLELNKPALLKFFDGDVEIMKKDN